jgi:hypothetical protein
MVWGCCETITVPRDIAADSNNTTATGLVGGSQQVSLSLEYLVDSGAASPSVKVSLAAPDGTSSDWSDSAPTAGYHVQEALLSAKPGTKLTLTVNNVTARLRWCEHVCC